MMHGDVAHASATSGLHVQLSPAFTVVEQVLETPAFVNLTLTGVPAVGTTGSTFVLTTPETATEWNVVGLGITTTLVVGATTPNCRVVLSAAMSPDASATLTVAT